MDHAALARRSLWRVLTRHERRHRQRGQQVDFELLAGAVQVDARASVRIEQRSVVDQTVQRAGLCLDGAHHLLALCGLGQIGLHQVHAGAGGLQLLLQGLRRRSRALVMAPHLPAGLCKGLAKQGAQSQGAAGDKDGFQGGAFQRWEPVPAGNTGWAK